MTWYPEARIWVPCFYNGSRGRFYRNGLLWGLIHYRGKVEY